MTGKQTFNQRFTIPFVVIVMTISGLFLVGNLLWKYDSDPVAEPVTEASASSQTINPVQGPIDDGVDPNLELTFPKLKYADVAGLCKVATLTEIEAQGWSLNPGRYVGVAAGEDLSDEDFKEQLETLQEELEGLNAQARELETTIAVNVAGILEV